MSLHLRNSALLLIGALLIGASAHGMNPARQGPNSSASCPETQLAADADENEAVTAAATGPIATGGVAPVPATKPAAAARPKTGGRWHSFLPGMFK